MHLSPEFGNTYKEIEKDGFIINSKLEMLLSSDTPIGITKSIGLGLISFSEAFAELNPDIVLVLGDRMKSFQLQLQLWSQGYQSLIYMVGKQQKG